MYVCLCIYADWPDYEAESESDTGSETEVIVAGDSASSSPLNLGGLADQPPSHSPGELSSHWNLESQLPLPHSSIPSYNIPAGTSSETAQKIMHLLDEIGTSNLVDRHPHDVRFLHCVHCSGRLIVLWASVPASLVMLFVSTVLFAGHLNYLVWRAFLSNHSVTSKFVHSGSSVWCIRHCSGSFFSPLCSQPLFWFQWTIRRFCSLTRLILRGFDELTFAGFISASLTRWTRQSSNSNDVACLSLCQLTNCLGWLQCTLLTFCFSIMIKCDMYWCLIFVDVF